VSTSSISSLSASTLLDELLKYKAESKQNALDQLGTDLQAGNLSAAQADYATLTGDSSSSTSSSTSSTTAPQDPVVEDLVTLGKDLKSGDTAAAENDYTNLKTDLAKAQESSASSSTRDPEAEQLLQLLQSLGTSSSTAAAAYTTSNTNSSS
jgi:hypothetical protein